MTRDTELAIGLGVAAILALAWFWQHGHATAMTRAIPTVAPSPPEPEPFNVADYNPARDIAGGVNLGDVNFDFPVNVHNDPFSISYPMIAALTPANMSTGTPQCGCIGSGVDGANSYNRAMLSLYDRTLAALAGLGQSADNVEVNVFLSKKSFFDRVPPPKLVSHVSYFGTQGSAVIQHINPDTGQVVYTS